MANRVLNLGGNLSARLASVLTLVQGVLTVQLHGAQNRIVTEAALPRRCSQQLAGQLAVLDRLKTVRGGNRRRAAELRAAVLGRNIAQLSQQQVQVRAVITVATRPARRENTGGAVEHIHRQTGIVSNSDQTGCLCNSARLQQGVLSEGHAGLGNIGCVHAGGVNHLGINVQAVNASAQNFAQFLELALIVACQNNLCVCHSFSLSTELVTGTG